MLIYLSEFRFNLPFAGTFCCTDEDGNSLLRKLEPPQHNNWEPKRDPKRGNQAIEQIRDWIRDVLRKTAGFGDDTTFSLAELNDLLPDSGNEDSGKKEDEKGAPKTDFPLRKRPETNIEYTELPVASERFLDYGT